MVHQYSVISTQLHQASPADRGTCDRMLIVEGAEQGLLRPRDTQGNLQAAEIGRVCPCRVLIPFVAAVTPFDASFEESYPR